MSQTDHESEPTAAGAEGERPETHQPDAAAGREAAPRDDAGVAGGAAAPGADDTAAGDVGAGDVGADDEEHLDIEALAASDPRSKAELLTELITAEAKRDEYLDDLRRSHAEFENYRKRVAREAGASREHGKGDVVQPLLEVLDDLDRTLQAAEDSADPGLAKGVSLVADKLASALQGVGVTRIDAVDVTFDPTQHEAVQQQPADTSRDEPHVTAILRPGYRLGDRVLRAAMVVVEQ